MAKRAKKTMLNSNDDKIFDGVFAVNKPDSRLDQVSTEQREDKGWGEIKKTRYRNKNRSDDIEQWSMQDMYFYTSEQYRNKIDPNYTPRSFIVGTECMNEVYARIKKQLQKPVTLTIMKDYIDWFMANKCPDLVSKYKVFKVNYLTYESNIIDFVKLIPVIERSKTKKVSMVEVDSNNLLEIDAIDAVYSINPDNLVKRYGLIIPVIYLIEMKKLTEEQSINTISQIVIDLVSKSPSVVDLIIKSTEKFNPYAKSCKFERLKMFVNELTQKTGLDFNKLKVRFSSSVEEPVFMRRESL